MGINCFAKHYFHGIYAFSKKKGNFTRSFAFAQKVKFYALQMLKKQNLTHPKAAKLATLTSPKYNFFLKDDTLHSLKKICILSENFIFHE